MNTVFWFRRDLRLQDNEALTEAVKSADEDSGSGVACVYMFDNANYQRLQGIRQHSLYESLRALSADLNSKLHILESKSVEDFGIKLIAACEEIKANTVFAMEAFDPKGISEQVQIAKQLKEKGLELRLIGSGYAVRPGTVRKPDGTNYRVYTPFYKGWVSLAETKPVSLPKTVNWLDIKQSSEIPKPTKDSPIRVIAGEAFALRTFIRFEVRALDNYDEQRNRADLSGTSHLSHALAHGEIHPRTLLAKLDDSSAHEVFRKEIAWREFYADVLFHYPHTVDDYYEPRFKTLRYDSGAEAKKKFEAWCKGETGFPMVDAGMRQLQAEGWMHNRVRMIVASFLVKDLHIEWTLGAKHFEEHLSDFDPASNSHGWQWTAGCGTDASPYYRIFNPILQGLKFDPNGDYVRKYVPELRHLDGAAAHEPWEIFDGYSDGYPLQIVDHSKERDESLARLEELKNIQN
jgi:deoxyribodipyrimidine photo-lyase